MDQFLVHRRPAQAQANASAPARTDASGTRGRVMASDPDRGSGVLELSLDSFSIMKKKSLYQRDRASLSPRFPQINSGAGARVRARLGRTRIDVMISLEASLRISGSRITPQLQVEDRSFRSARP